jgi:non-specific serine/threonine protein kinase
LSRPKSTKKRNSASKNQKVETATLQTPSRGFTPGTIIAGKYKIIKKLDEGGMGLVYQAEDSSLKRPVALKLLSSLLTQDKQARKRFIQEAHAASALDHPYICTIHEIYEMEDEQVFIAMGYYEGDNLKNKISKGPLPPEKAVQIIIQIAQGLSKAHQKGIVHRDIKPANIMFTGDGIAKIVDFGIAKLGGASRLTQTGATIGTAAYMSPEQASGEEVDHRTDLWSLGVVLYEMLTGQLPFKGDNMQSVIYSIINKNPQSINQVCAQCPELLQNILKKLLEKNPDHRFQTAGELMDALRSSRNEEVMSFEDQSFEIPVSAFQKKKHNLPSQLTSFIGRAKEIKEIRYLLSKNRLITLTGTGGSGKTRLALQAAADLVEIFAEGVWFIDLAPINDLKQVAGTTAEAMQISEEFGKPLLDTIGTRLQKKQILLLLDNCEHLLKACAEMAEKLLQNCPSLKIMATSHEALNVPGEIAWSVPSLSTPDPENLPDLDNLIGEYEAIELFVERAKGHQPGFRLSPTNAKTVAALCSQLDGIPLALELAAARIRQLGPQTILDRLDNRFQILQGASHSALPRHQTLLATVEWSYNLLTDNEKVLFKRCSVFRSGFDLESLEAICSFDPLSKEKIIDLISGLVDKSLVVTDLQEDGSLRYRLLETIRTYSRSKLMDSGDKPKIYENHFQYYLDLAERADLGRLEDTVGWLVRMEIEHDNLRAALEWAEDKPEDQAALAGALYWFWQAHSHYATGIEYLNKDKLKKLSPSRQLARACYGAGMMSMFFMGRFDDSLEMLDKSHALWKELGNQREAGIALMDKGFLLCILEEYQEGMSCFQECIETFQEYRDERLVLRSKLLLAFGYICQFQPDKAEDILKPLLETAKKFKITEGISNFNHYYSDCAMLRGDLKEGERRYANALVASLSLGDLFQTAIEMQGMAMCIAGQSRAHKAFRLNSAAMAELDELGVSIPYLKFWSDSLAKFLKHASSIIGEEAARIAEKEGREMGFENAVKYALEFDRD